MPTYIAFLRAVNVGKRQVKMQRLREHLAQNGFDDVATHIQSGNVRVATSERSAAKLQSRLQSVLSEEFGFDIPVVVRTAGQLRRLVTTVDAKSSPLSADARVYVGLANAVPARDGVTVLDAWDVERERVTVIGSDIVAWYDKPFNEVTLTNARVEKLVKAHVTFRDMKVIRALAQKWGQ